MNALNAIALLTIALLHCGPSIAVKCDFEKYPKNGCQDTTTQKCNEVTKECECKYDYTINLNGKCLKESAWNEKCVTSRQCLALGAKCLTPDSIEIKDDEYVSINETDVIKVEEGICKCVKDHYFNQAKNKCEFRVLGSKCTEDIHCVKAFIYCDKYIERCTCEEGYITDEGRDVCLPIRVYTSINNVETFVPGPICHSWDPVTRRCRIGSSWDGARSWSSFVWKLAVLCIVLILLMLLIGGIQRVRQNDTLISWGRAMEAYSARNSRLNSLRATRRNSPHTELGCMMITRNAHVIRLNDDPPPYEEAVAMSNSNPPQYRV